ncbi:HD domain-containing protein (plasmid) [Deinococcus taeanensis]|uniref:HD domain-containing phosphohydrolase n=1 Tax=Deinococcus taeanensis TaxID=2737050 RepID=UPI001CDCD83A|nr:HD domain-containing phosphohydrolase [Deinococcus taeanensis]UBV44468.1 HD domain-containing protein [Deinococcus taeanensis]
MSPGSINLTDPLDYQWIFEAAGVGLLEIDFHGCIRRINPDGAAFFGSTVDVLTGQSVMNLTYAEDIPRTVEALGRVIDGTVPLVVVEKRYVRADGEIVWSRSRVSLLRKTSGPPDSVLAVVADITELKRAQQDLEALNLSLRATLDGGLLGLGIALEARDLETSGHTVRVIHYSRRLGEALGLSDEQLTELKHGASLHDLGKLTIPDGVLLKPGRLDATEWAIMQTHALKGYEIATRIPTLPCAALAVIRSHHERWDGTGYPDRLSGEAIPLLARIFAVCDVFDALLSDRPYKQAWTQEAALHELRQQRGRHFDPRVVDAFVSTFEADDADGA